MMMVKIVVVAVRGSGGDDCTVIDGQGFGTAH